jgi:glycosyltransferase involved in cell wall biosynthesis
MKIVYSTDQIYLHGGVEKVMATKANYLANQSSFKVYIVTTEQLQNAPCYPFDSKIKFIDLGVNYNRSSSYFSIENLQKAVRNFKMQKKLIKELSPDVIISHAFTFENYWLYFIKNKAKLIKEVHSSRFFKNKAREKANFFGKLRISLDDYFDGVYDKIVLLNPHEKSYLKSNNGFVIPNPIESSLLRADVSKKQVIAAGRISPVKAFDQLIEAWALIHQAYPDWQLHFYGQDFLDTQQKLERLIEKHQLEHVIKFKGCVNNLAETMINYSIYALTSETECFPMVLLEALSVGLPIISYDCPNGPRNILTDGEDSILVANKNIPIFANNLKVLMQNENLRHEMGTKGIENVKRFSLQSIMQKWMNLFNLLVDKSK